MNEPVTVRVTVNAPKEKVWEFWNEPSHITVWCTGSPDWHTPKAVNDLRVGGRFVTTMEAKDGSQSFDVSGVYTVVEPYKRIEYTMDDGRTVSVVFEDAHDGVTIVETFDPEDENPRELQADGWQGILTNFKKHAEQ